MRCGYLFFIQRPRAFLAIAEHSAEVGALARAFLPRCRIDTWQPVPEHFPPVVGVLTTKGPANAGVEVAGRMATWVEIFFSAERLVATIFKLRRHHPPPRFLECVAKRC